MGWWWRRLASEQVPTYRQNVAAQLTPKQAGLFALWRQRRGTRRWPARSALGESDLAPWFGNFHLLGVESDGADYRYLIYGNRLSAYRERDFTGRLVSETPESRLRAILLACYGEVRVRGVPCLVRRPTIVFGQTKGDRMLPFETVRHWLMLPFGDTDNEVNRLLSLRDDLHEDEGSSDSIEFVPLEGNIEPYWRDIDAILDHP